MENVTTWFVCSPSSAPNNKNKSLGMHSKKLRLKFFTIIKIQKLKVVFPFIVCPKVSLNFKKIQQVEDVELDLKKIIIPKI